MVAKWLAESAVMSARSAVKSADFRTVFRLFFQAFFQIGGGGKGRAAYEISLILKMSKANIYWGPPKEAKTR